MNNTKTRYEIVKINELGYECGREYSDNIVKSYFRFCNLTATFPEWSFKWICITEKEVFTLACWPFK